MVRPLRCLKRPIRGSSSFQSWSSSAPFNSSKVQPSNIFFYIEICTKIGSEIFESRLDVLRRRCKRRKVHKARSRSRYRNTATRSTSRTADDDDEPLALRPLRYCRTSFCKRRGIRHRVVYFHDAAPDSNRIRVNSRDTRTRGCRWTSVGMRDCTFIPL